MLLGSILLWILLGPYLVVWCVFGLRLLTKPRSPGLGRELVRAAFLASFPASAGLALGLTLAAAEIDPGVKFLMVPFPAAVTGSWELLCLLAAVWWRMRLPLEVLDGDLGGDAAEAPG